MGASGSPPKSPGGGGRGWGASAEGKVWTHLLAWLALSSLWRPHATWGAGKRQGGREKRKDEREAHTQEFVLMAQRPNTGSHREIRDKTKHRC